MFSSISIDIGRDVNVLRIMSTMFNSSYGHFRAVGTQLPNSPERNPSLDSSCHVGTLILLQEDSKSFGACRWDNSLGRCAF